MEKLLKAGVIGCKGGGGKTFYCHSLIEGCKLEAVCDIREDFVKEVSKKYKVKGYLDYKEMIDKADINFVIINTPDYLHVEQAIYALKKGKHVYCEKPMAINLEDAIKLMKVAKNAKTRIQIGYELHTSEIYTRAEKAVKMGWCGEILFAFHDYLRPPWTTPEHFKLKKEKSGGLIVHDGCHYVDFLRWIINDDVIEVSCYAPPIKTKYYDGVLDNFRLNMRHKKGAISGMTWSHMFGVGINGDFSRQIFTYCFIGTEGSIYCDLQKRKMWFIKHKVDDEGKVYDFKFICEEDYSMRDWMELGHNILECLKDFVRRTLTGEPQLIPIEESFITEYICYAAEKSAVEKKALKIPEREKLLSLF